MERYNRNILIPQVGKTGQHKLLAAKILVAGAGGLGSTVLCNLASIGVGSIGIIDNDKLELSNLNRQYIHRFANLDKLKVDSAKEWIENFNPEINIKTYPIRLYENNYQDIITDYDLIIDCFDSYKSKFLLNKIAVKNNKILIHGGVTEFYGQVTTIIPNQTACLECIIPDAEIEKYTLKGVISPAVSTIASLQTLEALKIILNIESILKNKLLTFNGLTMDFRKINISQNPCCKLCGKN
jgi:molybdopterin/thiamine biosynthesis adenylyltransferase